MSSSTSTIGVATQSPEALARKAIEEGVQRGVAAGIEAVGELLTKPPEAKGSRPDNRALMVAIAALLLVGGQWAWNGRAHTDRMDVLEDRVDGIESSLGQVETSLASIQAVQASLGQSIRAVEEVAGGLERGQMRLTYATIAIADKVGASIQVPQE